MYQAIIIDDEKWVVKSLIAALRGLEGFEIAAELYDGLTGLRYLLDKEPDLAFIDVRLPGMNGLDILKEARKAGLSTLFIVISGHAEFAYAQKAMLHNAISYCLKPFSRSELTAAVEKALELLDARSDDREGAVRNNRQAPASPAIKNKTVAAMVEFLNDHYMDDISIQALADLCSINPNYAGQLFKQNMNQTVNAYLTGLRIEHAIWLLSNTDMPISLVASSVGYSDYFYFAKVFKKVTHATPSSYRHEEEPDEE